MSRFYAAIENARALVPVKGGLPAGVSHVPAGADVSDTPLLQLWQAVEARLPGRRRKVVQVTACTEGEQDSAVAIRFARLAGNVMGGGVVVLNDRPRANDPDSPVAFGPLPGGNGDLRALNRELLSSYWRLLLNTAHLVILDAPPVLSSPVSLGLAPTVDGVILLVEAERTRKAVARAARDALQNSGANLLGIALNKRRFPVPKTIYDRL